MEKDITEIKILLAEIKVDLKYHIKRTDLLDVELRALREDLEPVERHVAFVTGLGKFVIFIAIIATATAGVISIF